MSEKKLIFGRVLNRVWLVAIPLSFFVCLCSTQESLAQSKKTVRKVQEVNFSEMNLKGTFRNPDGAYLVQKRGIKFLPLYEVNKNMDARIRDSSFYVK